MLLKLNVKQIPQAIRTIELEQNFAYRQRVKDLYFLKRINMPSVYTHYKFACDAFDFLSEGLKEAVQTGRKFYDTGQSGADLLFYYKPYKTNDLRKHGSALHKIKADELFSEFKNRVYKSGNKVADIAYLTGYFTHFILDSTMHPYIWKCEEEKLAPHFVIEADYDRKLMLRDGVNPYNAKFLSFQVNDGEVREVCSRYLSCTPKQTGKIMRSRVNFTNLISCQNSLLRGFLKFLFRISSNPKGNDILIPGQDVEACADISPRLDVLYAQALEDIKIHSKEFEDFLLREGSLGARFAKDFE